MDVLHSRCCGLDVHKSSISACILLREAGRVQKHQRRFGAMTQELQELAEWLRQFGVTQVAMESSGVYWKPVWNILEGQFTVVLANAQHIKNVPGRKTDQKDAEWIAQLLQYGLLRASYIPCEIIRDLRDLTRMRASLSQEASRISSRIQKVLEDANVKLASVATNVLGKSGRAMLEDIITGEDNPEHLASLALGRLRVTIPITTCSRRKDPFPSSLFAAAFTGSNTVCGTRNCIARRTPRGHRATKTGPGGSGCSLGHETGDGSSGCVGSSSRNR